MNSSRPRDCFRGCALLCLALCLGFNAPSASAARRARSPAEKPRAAQSDAFPQADNTGGGDLRLKSDDEKIADALAAFADGFIAEDNADTDRALQSYQRSLALNPANSALAVKVALELARRGDVPQAISILKDAAKFSPTD